MTEKGAIGFNEEGYAQYKQFAREVARRVMNETPHRARWQYQGGGSGHQIWFTIISVECDPYTFATTLAVEPTYYTGGCTAPIPGADASTGYVTVEDVCGTLDFYTAAWLVGKTGRATYMYPRTGTCTPVWLIDDVCNAPECA